MKKGVLTAAFLAAMSGVAAAQPDRSSNTPTGWLWYLGASSTTINTATNDGFRLIDIERTSSNVFDAVLVQNSGTYAKTGQVWYQAQTSTALGDSLTANNRRLIDLEPYDSGGGVTRFYATAIPNTGADAAGWGWLFGVTPTQITDWVNNNPTPLRLIDIDSYVMNGTRVYSAVAVNNTGNQQQGWWHYYDQSTTGLANLLDQLNARIVDIEVHANPTVLTGARFSALLAPAGTTGWWWYTGVTGDQLADRLDLNAARLVDIERYTDAFGTTRFAAVMLDNANTATRRVRQIMWDIVSDGAQTGAYLKEVGGGVRVGFGVDHVFEPASSLKILHSTYAIDRAAAGLDSINASVFVGDRCNNNECPDGVNCNPGNESLSAVIRETMEQSDNNRTKVLHDRYGRTNLNNFALSLGMSRTQINHDIGCGLPANEFTLRDLGTIYEAVADGSLFSTAWRDTLFNLMNDSDENGMPSRLNNIITQEAALTDLTSSEISAFRNAVFIASKGGSYGIPVNGQCCTYHRSSGGWAEIPFKNALGIIFMRDYVLGTFVNNEPNDTLAAQANSEAFYELLREPIREALASWDAACNEPSTGVLVSQISVPVGGTLTINSIQGGTQPITEQWRRNGVALSNGTRPSGAVVSGATTPTLTITNMQPADAGTFRIDVSNGCGTDSSGNVTVIVICPADWDESGGVDGDDIAAFITDWQSGNADIDGSGGTDGDDITFFFSRWQAGC